MALIDCNVRSTTLDGEAAFKDKRIAGQGAPGPGPRVRTKSASGDSSNGTGGWGPARLL